MAFALSVSGLGLDLGLGFEALVLALAFNILALTCTRSHDNSILCSKAFLLLLRDRLVVVIGEFRPTLHSMTPAGHPGPAPSPRPNPSP